MNLELCKEFSFEASHILSKHPGKCSRLHGHSWKLRVYVKGEVDQETGFVMDYADLNGRVQPLIESLDHRHLGEWSSDITAEMLKQDGSRPDWELVLPDNNYVDGLPIDFYPSSENLILYIVSRFEACSLPWSKVELDETCTSSCILTREEYEKVRRG